MGRLGSFFCGPPACAGLTSPATLLFVAPAKAGADFPGIGRSATPAEIRAWDIDVRPDFTGLPAGSGSVASGEKGWGTRCAACHGTFGETKEGFTPPVGGTSRAEIEAGRRQAVEARGVARP